MNESCDARLVDEAIRHAEQRLEVHPSVTGPEALHSTAIGIGATMTLAIQLLQEYGPQLVSIGAQIYNFLKTKGKLSPNVQVNAQTLGEFVANCCASAIGDAQAYLPPDQRK